ncbi:MAG: FkbM family methyltransferase [Candidatus Polarisedimenticolia bacterium]
MNRAEGDVDRKVFSRFFDDGNTERVFVDVGAARPDYLSVSALFRKKGWRVIAIEPNPEFAAMHRELGHEIFECACGTEDRDSVEFVVVNSHSEPYRGGAVSYESFSSLGIKEGYAKLLPASCGKTFIKVRVRRLDSILQDAGVDRIGVLSVDVEGWELDVLEGLDVARYRPDVIILENFLRLDRYKVRLRAVGYGLWRSLFPNQVFVRQELLRQIPVSERIAGNMSSLLASSLSLLARGARAGYRALRTIARRSYG